MKAISLYVIATGGMKMIICRCEEVTLKDIQDTADKYECSAREVKLRTRAGMGYCGGRTCRTAVDAVLEEVTGRSEERRVGKGGSCGGRGDTGGAREGR